jgi:CRISPR-associated exonuclease Cas4
MRSERPVFTVTDLKQYSFCPRIVYYTYCLPLIRPTTYKMEAGISAHEGAGERARRRTLAAYGLKQGERHFDVLLKSEELGLRGRLDLLIQTDEWGGGELIPVEYKLTRQRVGGHVRSQLAAYGIMLEEAWGRPARSAFVYSLVTRGATRVELTEALRADVRQAVRSMREMVTREAMPEPAGSRRRCVNCEFRRFCNDVL